VTDALYRIPAALIDLLYCVPAGRYLQSLLLWQGRSVCAVGGVLYIALGMCTAYSYGETRCRLPFDQGHDEGSGGIWAGYEIDIFKQ
jgi:hypothetical protein